MVYKDAITGKMSKREKKSPKQVNTVHPGTSSHWGDSEESTPRWEQHGMELKIPKSHTVWLEQLRVSSSK